MGLPQNRPLIHRRCSELRVPKLFRVVGTVLELRYQLSGTVNILARPLPLSFELAIAVTRLGAAVDCTARGPAIAAFLPLAPVTAGRAALSAFGAGDEVRLPLAVAISGFSTVKGRGFGFGFASLGLEALIVPRTLLDTASCCCCLTEVECIVRLTHLSRSRSYVTFG